MGVQIDDACEFRPRLLNDYSEIDRIVNECLAEIGTPDNIKIRIAPHKECGLEVGETTSSVRNGKLSLFLRVDELWGCVSVNGIPNFLNVVRHELRHCKDLQYVFDAYGMHFQNGVVKYSEVVTRLGFRIITEYAAHRVINHKFTQEDRIKLSAQNAALISAIEVCKKTTRNRFNALNDIVNQYRGLVYQVTRLAASCDGQQASAFDEMLSMLPAGIQYKTFTTSCMMFSETLANQFDTPLLYSLDTINKIGINSIDALKTYDVHIIELPDGNYDVALK